MPAYNKTIFCVALLILTQGCGESSDENTTSTASPPEQLSSDPITTTVPATKMTQIYIPEDFDWSLTRDIELELTIIDRNKLLLTQNPIKIYSPASDSAAQQLLYSGQSNNQGKVFLSHKIRKEASTLLVKVYHHNRISLIELNFDNEDFTSLQPSIHKSVFL